MNRNYYLRLKNGSILHFFGDIDNLLIDVVKNAKIDINRLGYYTTQQIEKFNRNIILEELCGIKVLKKEEYNRLCYESIKSNINSRLKN